MSVTETGIVQSIELVLRLLGPTLATLTLAEGHAIGQVGRMCNVLEDVELLSISGTDEGSEGDSCRPGYVVRFVHDGIEYIVPTVLIDGVEVHWSGHTTEARE